MSDKIYMVIRERASDKPSYSRDRSTGANRYETKMDAIETASRLAVKYNEPYLVLGAVSKVQTELAPVTVTEL